VVDAFLVYMYSPSSFNRSPGRANSLEALVNYNTYSGDATFLPVIKAVIEAHPVSVIIQDGYQYVIKIRG
jgi:hypothetical protein